MPVKINGSTSGSVTLAAPATGTDVTLTLPGSTGTVPLLAGSNTWTGTQSFAGATLTGAGLDLITTQSFSAASSVSVNNCFSSTYENYLVMGRVTDASAIHGLRIRMRVGGTDNSSANYDNSNDVMGTTGAITQSDGGAGATYYNVAGMASGTEGAAFSIQVLAPQLTVRTGIISHSARSSGLYFGYAYLTVTTAYDGFTIYPSTGTINGNLRVYGYRN